MALTLPSPDVCSDAGLDTCKGSLTDQVQIAKNNFCEGLLCKAAGFQKSPWLVLIPPCV